MGEVAPNPGSWVEYRGSDGPQIPPSLVGVLVQQPSHHGTKVVGPWIRDWLLGALQWTSIHVEKRKVGGSVTKPNGAFNFKIYMYRRCQTIFPVSDK